MLFRGKKVFVEVDAGGKIVLAGGRASMKYRLEDERVYNPNPTNLCDPGGAPLSSPPPSAASSRQAKASRSIPAGAIVAYTDGACSGNPGPAGLGYCVAFPDGRRIQKGEPLGMGTNNIAELTAILRVLELVQDKGAPLVIHTDSAYSIGVLTLGWKAKANQALIRRIRDEISRFAHLELRKVKGHAGVPDNELVDELARSSCETQTVVES